MITPEFIFTEDLSFAEKALSIFEFQRKNNPVYKRFCEALGIHEVQSISEIPLMPIQAFKDTKVVTWSPGINENASIYFQSSGTSGMERSKHLVLDPELYRKSVMKGIQHFYDLEEYVIWAYTPGYIENPNSSLIWMLNALIESEKSGMSQFVELNKALDEKALKKIKVSGKRLMLFGAAFGLLDLLEKHPIQLPENTVILETGGMKTHRREITKEALHQQLAEGFGLSLAHIHSEYGMTELLSQAYAKDSLWFECPPWMKVSIRDSKNPMKEEPAGNEGLIGVMDLANLYSCSFILTGDKGLQREDGKFRVQGRWNPQNLRGCNFLIDRD